MNAIVATTAPCPQCLEAADVALGTCPSCGSDLHVDVLTPPIADDRTRYRVARELAALGSPWPAFPALQAALKPPGGLLARHVTRAEAALLTEGLAAHALDASSRPSPGPPPPGAPGAPPPLPFTGEARTSRPWWLFVAGLAACLAIAALTIVQLRRWRILGPPPLPYAELAERGRRSTVVLMSGDCQGSGFFVSPDLLLTNAHVLCGDTTEARIGTARQPATLVNIDDELDLALVRVEGANGTPLKLADAADLDSGDLVVAAGAPLGHEGTVAKGTVTRPFIPIWGVLHIEAKAAISPGNSGGPMLNDLGEAVGVVSKLRTLGDRRWALAVPVSYVSDWLPEGRAARGRGWDRRVAEAARSAERELKPFEAARQRPMLLGAHYVKFLIDSRTGEYGMGQLLFVVAGPSAASGGEPAQLTVSVSCGDAGPKETALGPWVSIDSHPERTSRLDVLQLRPFAAWARRRGLTGAVVVGSGETWIRYPNQCTKGELALLDGGTVTDKIPIE